MTVCVAGGVARGIVDLSRVLSRGSRSPRLAVQPRHDPLRRLGFRPGSAACAILKAALKTTTLHAGRELPTLDTGVANLLPLINENQDDSIPSCVEIIRLKRKAKKGIETREF